MYIQLTNVSKKIKSNDILKDINLRMESGKIRPSAVYMRYADSHEIIIEKEPFHTAYAHNKEEQTLQALRQ